METQCSFWSLCYGRELNTCVRPCLWCVRVRVRVRSHTELWGKAIEFMVSFARDELCSPGILRASLTSDCLIAQINGF